MKDAKHSQEDGKTVFVCVRERGKDGASCAGRGARQLLTDMRTMLDAEGISPEELAIRPCGCLGLCKKGPVLLAASGEAAQEKKPAKPKKKARGVYTKVRRGDTRGVLREVLAPAPRKKDR